MTRMMTVICEIHMDWQVNNWICVHISFAFDACTPWPVGPVENYCRISNKMVSVACS